MNASFAIISANTIRDYAFSIPLSAIFWRDVAGIEPICLLVDEWTSARDKTVLQALDHHGIKRLQVSPVPEYGSGYVAQNVREHAAALDLPEDAWLIPSDADLFPLKREFYRQHENGPLLTVLYANGDHWKGKEDVLSIAARGRGDFQTLPTCHCVMRVSTWRELYGLKVEDVGQATKRTLDSWLKPKMEGKTPAQAGWEAHMSDQRILTEKLCRAEWFPREAQLIERRGHPPVDRLCRSVPESWDKPLDGTWVDAHVDKAPDSAAHWPRIRRLIAHYLPQHLAWADAYQRDFRGSYAD